MEVETITNPMKKRTCKYSDTRKQIIYKWRDNNKDEFKEYQKQYYKDYYAKNKDKLLAKMKDKRDKKLLDNYLVEID